MSTIVSTLNVNASRVSATSHAHSHATVQRLISAIQLGLLLQSQRFTQLFTQWMRPLGALSPNR
jgi:hypothetical protein